MTHLNCSRPDDPKLYLFLNFFKTADENFQEYNNKTNLYQTPSNLQTFFFYFDYFKVFPGWAERFIGRELASKGKGGLLPSLQSPGCMYLYH